MGKCKGDYWWNALLEVLTCLGSKLLSRAFPVKQDECIEVVSYFLILQGSIDTLGAAFLLNILQGLAVGFCLFATAFYNLLKEVLLNYVS